MSVAKGILSGIDRAFFDDALRRAVSHADVIRSPAATGRLGRAAEALRRERAVTAADIALRPDIPRFLGGTTGRSGTTWLINVFRLMLGETHALPGEQGMIVLSMFRAAAYEYYQFGGESAGRNRYLEHFERQIRRYAYRRRRIYGSGLVGLTRYVPRRAISMAMDRLRESLSGVEQLEGIRHAFGDFYIHLLNYHAAMVFGRPAPWISKEPPYGRHVDDLVGMIPDARVVILARDGRETALSMYKRGWMSTVRACMDRWATFTAMTLDAVERVPSENVLVVRYDDLVTGFAQSLKRIFAFYRLGEPDVERIHSSGNSDLMPRASSIGRWKAEIQPADLSYFEDTYGALMERLGYSG